MIQMGLDRSTRPSSPFPVFDSARLLNMALCGYSINTYRRCDIGCRYCINGVQGMSQPVVSADAVRARLLAELRCVPAGATLGIGTVVDAYPAAEREHRVTRIVLETLIELNQLFVVVTKNTRVRRDLDVLVSCEASRVCVSLSTLDADVAAHLEPGAPSPAARLQLVGELAAVGITVEVSIAPWIPGVTRVEELLAQIDEQVIVSIAPLNTTWISMRYPPGDYTQTKIDAAYLAEVERVGTPPNVAWLAPPSWSPEVSFQTVSSGDRWRASWNRWSAEQARRTAGCALV
jgi:DNA repair photolyase